ncbi:hypothetical protein [Roseateles toxinivorans]|uniref:Uncharacterized protein n=1 Tax=Roseateles toxinivorans TaxID=270368 RepID=A0A4R6QPU5_9BURK|nr:hypothetical protein [Roseateles toxinivorans]TDP72469.1 hypothetical protein DES47_102214 [Roseateles toxinivorans]
MQNQTAQSPTLDQAALQDAQQQPIELDLQQLKAVSGGDGSVSTPVKGW